MEYIGLGRQSLARKICRTCQHCFGVIRGSDAHQKLVVHDVRMGARCKRRLGLPLSSSSLMAASEASSALVLLYASEIAPP